MNGTSETVRFTTETFGTNSRHSAYLRLGVDRHAMLAACKYLDLNPEFCVHDIRGAFVKSNVVPDWVELDVIHPSESGEDQLRTCRPDHHYCGHAPSTVDGQPWSIQALQSENAESAEIRGSG